MNIAMIRCSSAEDYLCKSVCSHARAPLPRSPVAMGCAVEACRRNDSRAGREEAEFLPVHSSA